MAVQAVRKGAMSKKVAAKACCVPGMTLLHNLLEGSQKHILGQDGANIDQRGGGYVVANSMVSSGRGGAVVNMGSVGSKTACTDVSAYCCSKAALHMLSMTMALELGPNNIRVNTVGPSLVMTDMVKKGWSDPEVKASISSSKMPLRRLTEIEDVVNAVLFLLSDKAAMISGTLVPVDGALLSGIL